MAGVFFVTAHWCPKPPLEPLLVSPTPKIASIASSALCKDSQHRFALFVLWLMPGHTKCLKASMRQFPEHSTDPSGMQRLSLHQSCCRLGIPSSRRQGQTPAERRCKEASPSLPKEGIRPDDEAWANVKGVEGPCTPQQSRLSKALYLFCCCCQGNKVTQTLLHQLV